MHATKWIDLESLPAEISNYSRFYYYQFLFMSPFCYIDIVYGND